MPDCTQYQLEQKVGHFVHWLFVAAEATKKARLEREERWRQWEEERKREEEERQRLEAARQREERKRQLEELHRSNLEESSEAWISARRLRRFIRACEVVLQSGSCSLPAGDWQATWLAWAREHADRLDPMTNGFLKGEHERLTMTSNGEDDSGLEGPSLEQVMDD